MKVMTTIRRASTTSDLCFHHLTRSILVVFVAGGSLTLIGCEGAPSVTIAGAYFPAWLLCAIIAVLVAVLARALMVVTGLSNRIPFQLAVCSSVGVLVALMVWWLWVVH